MTKITKNGTLSTITADKSIDASKEKDVIGKMKFLLGFRKVVFHSHANKRMGQRNVIYYEVLQALSFGRHDSKRDRYSKEFRNWEYSIEGETKDARKLRIGISFEIIKKTDERLLIITVIDLRGANI